METLSESILFLQGEQPHAGFPEANYHTNAERLARAGLRVVVVEQTETPAQLAVRNEERKKQRLPKVRTLHCLRQGSPTTEHGLGNTCRLGMQQPVLFCAL